MGPLQVIPHGATTKFPHSYSSFSLLPTFSSSIPAALGCLSHWPLSHHFSLSPGLNSFFELFAWQMTQVSNFRTCLVTSQHSSCSHVGLVWLGPFSFAKCKYLWPQALIALGAANCEGFSAIQARSARCGITQQSLRAEVQIPIPLSPSPSQAAPFPFPGRCCPRG